MTQYLALNFFVIINAFKMSTEYRENDSLLFLPTTILYLQPLQVQLRNTLTIFYVDDYKKVSCSRQRPTRTRKMVFGRLQTRTWSVLEFFYFSKCKTRTKSATQIPAPINFTPFHTIPPILQ